MLKGAQNERAIRSSTACKRLRPSTPGSKKLLHLLFVVTTAVASGCAVSGPEERAPPPTSPGVGTGAPPSAATTGVVEETFDNSLALPYGWVADRARWGVIASEHASSAPNLLRGTGGGARSIATAPPLFSGLDATMRLQLQGGDGSVGFAFWYSGDGSYHVVAFDVGQGRWRHTVSDAGETETVSASRAQEARELAVGEWATLRVRAERELVQAWHDGTLVIEVDEGIRASSGVAGPYVQGNAEALVDDLAILPLHS